MQEHWTAKNIPDQSGRVIIITGTNSGIGFETAKELARRGAQVVLACRTLEKGEQAAARLRTEIPQASLQPMALELGSLASVRAFADAFRTQFGRLDVLINNAGIMMTPYGKTTDGFEQQFGVNHLGHFALTGLLIDLLTSGSRVVNVSSLAHCQGVMDFDNLMYEQGGYNPSSAYQRSKLANLMFTLELQRRLEAAGMPSIAVAAHPGVSYTNLARYMLKGFTARLAAPLFRLLTQSTEMGALPTLRAATDPQAQGGQYFGPGGRREIRGYPVVVQFVDAARDPQVARRLWEVSEKLTGVSFLPLPA
ncbi:MAG: oxidoreductase [Anaerolineales bacterium]